MSKIDQVSQGLLKQVAAHGMFVFGAHRKLTEICKESSPYYLISGKFKPVNQPDLVMKSWYYELFRADLLRTQIHLLSPDIIIFAHGKFAAKTRNELLLDEPECKHPWKIIWDGAPYHQDIKQSELERFHLSYYDGEENRQITGFRIDHPRTLSRKARKCLIENLPSK